MILDFKQYKKSKDLTVLSVVEDRDYLLWQQEVQSYYMNEKYPHINFEVVVLYEGEAPSKWANYLSTISNTSYYKIDNDFYKSYKASYKPLGIHYRINDLSKPLIENILAIDSDVIINKNLDYNSLFENSDWILSNCENYLGYKYLSKNLTEDRLQELADIVGISIDKVKSIEKAGGAQYLYKNTSKHMNLFEKMAIDSVNLYNHLKVIAEEDNSKIQIWTAEMWSQLWNIELVTNARVLECMDFCMAPDPIHEMNTKTFTHFAGSPPEDSFRKTIYKNAFTADLSNVTNQSNCAWYWKTLVEKYKSKSFGANLNS